MKNILKSRIFWGVTVALAVAVFATSFFAVPSFAQGPVQGGTPPAVVNNQAVLDLLKTTQQDLYQLRQSGKSWLDIATSKGVTQTALVDALLKPITDRHAWMAQTYPQFNATQMTEWMRTRFTNDLPVTQFGTLTDRHVFGGVGMMGQWNYGYGMGMYRGGMRGGMMGQWDAYGWGGGMHRGMMRGWNTVPYPAPVPAQ